MQVLRTLAELRTWRVEQQRRSRAVALVPTMGYLHEGHLDLVREGRRRIPSAVGEVALTIFVNPTQFDRSSDLSGYPRDEAGDLRQAEAAGVDLVFAPHSPAQIYPPGASVWVEVEGLDDHLCGATRPGHFRGVCTVVCKLWQLFQPDLGLFGRKDFQQLAIVRRMHQALFLSGEVVGVATRREPDGLAMSSRNARLSAEGRRHATAVPRFLAEVQRRYEAGARGVDELLAGASEALSPGRIDYVSLVDVETLQPVARVEGPSLVAVAVFFDDVRLIDNTVLGENGPG